MVKIDVQTQLQNVKYVLKKNKWKMCAKRVMSVFDKVTSSYAYVTSSYAYVTSSYHTYVREESDE